MDRICQNGLRQLALLPPVFCKLILDIDRVLGLSRFLFFFPPPLPSFLTFFLLQTSTPLVSASLTYQIASTILYTISISLTSEVRKGLEQVREGDLPVGRWWRLTLARGWWRVPLTMPAAFLQLFFFFICVSTRHSQVLAQVLITNSTELMPCVSSLWDGAETCQMDDRERASESMKRL